MMNALPLLAVLALIPTASAFSHPVFVAGGVRARASLAPQPGSGRCSLFHQSNRAHAAPLGLCMADDGGLGGGESGSEGAGVGGTPDGASVDQRRYVFLSGEPGVRRCDRSWPKAFSTSAATGLEMRYDTLVMVLSRVGERESEGWSGMRHGDEPADLAFLRRLESG